ncbi:ABC transporter permease [Bacillus kexueae]|uniref:ABC transporter permease n=1 Tax=Aeribacillus kexueae TaxID=2078952 RepID=UPI001FAFF469|nr:ABC transporter permease [Bacillus kexueae]
MNFLKRAFLSVKARKGKSILMLFVLSVIFVLVVSGLSIQSAAEKSSDLAREQLGGEVTLEYDVQKAMENTETDSEAEGQQRRAPIQSSPIPVEQAEDLLNSSYIKSYNFYSNSIAIAESFEPVEEEVEEETTTENTRFQNGQGGGNARFEADVTTRGVTFSEILSTFTDGTATLLEGRHITEEDEGANVVMIEQTLAENNELAIGDTITISSTEEEGTEVTLEIVGIYETTATTDGQLASFAFSIPNNVLYVPHTVSTALKGEDSAGTIDQAVYYMADPAYIDSFIEEAEANGVVDFTQYTLDANDQLYQQMVGPIENVASFSSNTVFVITIAGAIILSLIVMMSIRERTYEMGVLLAIGEKKWKLIGQFLVEIIIIAALSLGVASVSGNVIANQLGEELLSQQITQVEEDQTVPQGFGRGGMGRLGLTQTTQTSVDPISELSIQVSGEELLILGGIGLLIAVISTLIPSLSIIRLQPKTILTKQE